MKYTTSLKIVVFTLVAGCLAFAGMAQAKSMDSAFVSVSGFGKSAPVAVAKTQAKAIAPGYGQTDNYYFLCGSKLGDRDGNQYPTTMIGNQCWMTENLRTQTGPDGMPLTFGFDGSERDCITESNERGTEKDCDERGALYSYSAIAKEGFTPGLCPRGWRLPTDNDFAILEQYLTDPGNSCDANRGWQNSGSGMCLSTNSEGCENAGSKLKSGGSTGFNLDMIGVRWFNYPTQDGKTGSNYFDGAGEYTMLWSQSPRGFCGWPTIVNYRIARLFSTSSAGISRVYNDVGDDNISLNLPARCIREY